MVHPSGGCAAPAISVFVRLVADVAVDVGTALIVSKVFVGSLRSGVLLLF